MDRAGATAAPALPVRCVSRHYLPSLLELVELALGWMLLLLVDSVDLQMHLLT